MINGFSRCSKIVELLAFYSKDFGKNIVSKVKLNVDEYLYITMFTHKK